MAERLLEYVPLFLGALAAGSLAAIAYAAWAIIAKLDALVICARVAAGNLERIRERLDESPSSLQELVRASRARPHRWDIPRPSRPEGEQDHG